MTLKTLFNNKTCVLILLAVIFSLGLVNHFRSAMIHPMAGNGYPIGEFLSQTALGNQVDAQPDTWQSRYFSCVIAGKFFDLINQRPYSEERVINTYGIYYAGWIFLTFLALIFLTENALVPMLGIMAGVLINTMPFPHPLIYPWDGPSMFCFTLACLLYLRKWFWPMVVVVIFGTMIKETNLLFCLLFLFQKNWKLSTRIIFLVATVLAGMALIHLLTPKINFHGTSWELSIHRVLANFSFERVLKLWPILIANAGGMLLLPYSIRKTGNYELGLVFLAFLIGQGLDLIGSGSFDEYRDWYELLPISWLLFAKAFQHQSNIAPTASKAKSSVVKQTRDAQRPTQKSRD